MTEKDVLIKAITFFKENDNREVRAHIIFDLLDHDPLIPKIKAILSKFPFIVTLPAMGLLETEFLIHPDYYHSLMLTTPEEFLEEYEKHAIEQNETIKKDKERTNKQDQILNLTIDDLVDKIVNKPKIKNRLIRAEIIAGISALAAVIAMIAGLKEC